MRARNAAIVATMSRTSTNCERSLPAGRADLKCRTPADIRPVSILLGGRRRKFLHELKPSRRPTSADHASLDRHPEVGSWQPDAALSVEFFLSSSDLIASVSAPSTGTVSPSRYAAIPLDRATPERGTACRRIDIVDEAAGAARRILKQVFGGDRREADVEEIEPLGQLRYVQA